MLTVKGLDDFGNLNLKFKSKVSEHLAHKATNILGSFDADNR